MELRRPLKRNNASINGFQKLEIYVHCVRIYKKSIFHISSCV